MCQFVASITSSLLQELRYHMEGRQVKIKHVNEVLAMRASATKMTKNKRTKNSIIINVVTLVRMPVMKVSFNAHCCCKYMFVLVTEANVLSLRKAEETKKKPKPTKTIECCLPTTKEGKIQQGTNN